MLGGEIVGVQEEADPARGLVSDRSGLLLAVGAALAGGWQAGHQPSAPSTPWALAGSVAAFLLLVGHVAFALNAFGMILSSTTPTSDGRSD